MKENKTVDELFDKYRSKNEGYGTVKDIFKAGHASRDEEVADLVKDYNNCAHWSIFTIVALNIIIAIAVLK